MGLGKLGRSGLSKHIEYQFQRGHARPRFGDLIRQDRILYALLDATVLPFGGQLLAHLNGLQALIDPLPRIPLALLDCSLRRIIIGVYDTQYFVARLLEEFCYCGGVVGS